MKENTFSLCGFLKPYNFTVFIFIFRNNVLPRNAHMHTQYVNMKCDLLPYTYVCLKGVTLTPASNFRLKYNQNVENTQTYIQHCDKHRADKKGKGVAFVVRGTVFYFLSKTSTFGVKPCGKVLKLK